MAGDGPTLVLVRHGETEWSRTGLHTGRTDVPLTEAGREAARRVGARLAGRTFALVLTSPLSRARETCEAAGLGENAQLEPDLQEFDYGDYEGISTPEIRETRPAWNLWRDGSPDGERPEDVGVRADRVIARALAERSGDEGSARDSGGDVALFAHGHVLRVLAARWVELTAAHGGHLALGTASLSELGYERERRVIWLWNDTSHL